MMFWLELAYARWVVRSVRSMPLTRWGRLRLPSLRAELGLLGLWLVVLTMMLSTSSRSGWGLLLVLLAISFVVMASWRFVGEQLSTASPLRYMVVTGCSYTDVPRSDRQRAGALQAEWERRVGAVATTSLFTLVRLNRRIGAGSLAAGVLLTSLGTAYAVSLSGAVSNLYSFFVVGYLLGAVWSFLSMRKAFATYRADLAAVFGEPLPPGPPGDPARFEEWRRSVPGPAPSPGTVV